MIDAGGPAELMRAQVPDDAQTRLQERIEPDVEELHAQARAEAPPSAEFEFRLDVGRGMFEPFVPRFDVLIESAQTALLLQDPQPDAHIDVRFIAVKSAVYRDVDVFDG